MKITPRPYQANAILRSIDAFDRGIKRQLFISATGTGKTYTSTFLNDEWQRRGKKKTLFLVDQIELAYQTRKSFLNADPNIKVGIEMNKHSHSPKDDVVISSIPTIGRKGSKRIKKFDPEEYGLIIVDEAHKSISESWIRVLNYFQVGPDNFDPQKLLFGMTATPNRPDGRPMSVLYDDIIERYDIRWALEHGWLTDFEFIRVKTETDISDVPVSNGEFNQTKLATKVNNNSRNAQIYKSYRTFSDGEPALCFCASVDHARVLSELFNHNGVKSAVISAETPKEKRAEFIDGYKAGDIKVLFNYGTLTTGFDAPDTRTIILGRPIGSELLYQQIIGRGLRPSTDSLVDSFDTSGNRKLAMRFSKKPYAQIIDFHDVTRNRSVCTPATLFGLHPDITIEAKKRFYKDVVEVLDQVQKEHSVDVSTIQDLDDIELVVSRSKSKLSQALHVPEEVALHSNKGWVKITDDHYEISFPVEEKILIVTTNQLDQYELNEYDMKTKKTTFKNSFGSLAGVINTADKYADANYDTKLADIEPWMKKGVTESQSQYLRRFLSKKGLKIDAEERYKDTGLGIHYFNGERLNKGMASRLIDRLFAKKK